MRSDQVFQRVVCAQLSTDSVRRLRRCQCQRLLKIVKLECHT